MKNALITGITSYLGRTLAARLMAEGIVVHALVRPASKLGLLDVLPERPVLHVYTGTTQSVVAAVTQARPDVVFHLATRYVRQHTSDDIEPIVQSNLLFGMQLVEAMSVTGVHNFINVGSYFQHFDTDDYRPVNLYAASKQAFEDILAYYIDTGDLNAVTLILFEVYGPGDWRVKLVGAIQQAQQTGKPLPLPARDVVLDLVYVDDVVDAFVEAAKYVEQDPQHADGRHFAVSAQSRYSIREVVDAFVEVSGGPVPTAPGALAEPARTLTTPWQGPPIPGWRPQVSLKEGLSRLISASPQASN